MRGRWIWCALVRNVPNITMVSIRNTPRRGIISRKFCGWRWRPAVRNSRLKCHGKIQNASLIKPHKLPGACSHGWVSKCVLLPFLSTVPNIPSAKRVHFQFISSCYVETYHHSIHEVAPDQGINTTRSSHQSTVGIKDGAAQGALRVKTQNVSATKTGKTKLRTWLWKSRFRKATVTSNHMTHLPTRLPCKPSPLQTLCGPVPEGFRVLAASPGCPQCAPHCWKKETDDRHSCVQGWRL